MKNSYIGQSNNELVFQKLDDNGLIKGFDTFNPVELVSGTTVLSQSGWTHDVQLDGIEYKLETGMPAHPIQDMPEHLKDCYTCETASCEVCGAIHDGDDMSGHSSDPTWAVSNECEVVCMGCRDADNVLILLDLDNIDHVFKSKNLDSIDLKGYREVETIFCDASGMGSVGERALTKSQTFEKTREFLKKHGALYSGITGVGRFQVYITFFKKRTKRVKKAA
jgi:hypothetical protein